MNNDIALLTLLEKSLPWGSILIHHSCMETRSGHRLIF